MRLSKMAHLPGTPIQATPSRSHRTQNPTRTVVTAHALIRESRSIVQIIPGMRRISARLEIRA
jgi:hypothetical protein